MTIFNRLAFFIFIFGIIFNNFALSANEKKRIAVFDFNAKNAPKAYADIARDALEINLHNSNAFTVLERSLIDLILKEQGLQMSGCTDTSCVVQIGKLLSADLVVIGSLSKITTYTLSVKMVDIGKGSIILAEAEKAASEDDIESAVKRIADRLAANVTGQIAGITADNNKGEVKEEKPAIEKKPTSSKGTYGFLSFSFIAISAGLAGTGYYYDIKLKNSISDYNSLADRYHATTDANEAVSLHNSMSSKKKDADKYEKTRNILYGAGIGTTVIAAFFIYKYFSAKPAESASLENNYLPVIPVLYTSGFNGYNLNKHEKFYGAGLLIKF